jgi:hypothetical protein
MKAILRAAGSRRRSEPWVFPQTWLDLREPADHAARDNCSAGSCSAKAAGENPVIVDLGCGTGSTIRAFDGHFDPGLPNGV